MNWIKHPFNATDGSKIRNVIRAAILVAAAFGLKVSTDQLAVIMLLVEAIFGRWYGFIYRRWRSVVLSRIIVSATFQTAQSI